MRFWLLTKDYIMKLTRKALRKLILKEFKDATGDSDYRFRGGGGFGLPPDEPEDGGGGRKFTPCENFDSNAHKKSLKIIQSLFQQAYETRGDTYTFLDNSGFFSEDQLYSINTDAEIYLESDLATELCKARNKLEKRMEILISLTDPKILFSMLNDY